MPSKNPTTPPPAALTDVLAQISALDARLGSELAAVSSQWTTAENEIERARAVHPRHNDSLFHSFALLDPTHSRMNTDFVYRSHCREILHRVVTGADPRPGTAAEVCSTMLEVSLRLPLRSSAFGLYTRMWKMAGFPEFPELAELNTHHEALEGAAIDSHEDEVRRKLAVPARYLHDIVCRGRHHSVEVHCAYARPASEGR